MQPALHSPSSPSSPVPLLSGVLLSAPPQAEVLNRSVPGLLIERGPAQFSGGPVVGAQGAPVLLRSGGPSRQEIGIAGVFRGMRLPVSAGQALIAADDDRGQDPQAKSVRSLGLARSKARASAPLRTLERSRFPVLVKGQAPGIALLGGIDLDQPGFPQP